MITWQVWWAWYPVRIETRHQESFGDGVGPTGGYVIVASQYRWRWLANVARRKNPKFDPRVDSELGLELEPIWQYAPAHVAVTQEYS